MKKNRNSDIDKILREYKPEKLSFSAKIVSFFFSTFKIFEFIIFMNKGKERALKEKLKYFKPVIKKGFFGDYVEWHGRD